MAPTERQPGIRQDPAYERALASGVGGDVLRVLSGEPQLQRRVLGNELRVGPKRIAEGEPLVPEIASWLGQMKAVRHVW